jgi:hypothetical protein
MIKIRPARKSEVRDLQELNNEVFVDNQQYDDDLDMDWLKSKRFQKAYVNAYIKNTEAVDFYKRNGFLEIDISLERNI